MSRLEINDISFCETVVHNHVQGGGATNYLLSVLTPRISEFSKQRFKKHNPIVVPSNIAPSSIVPPNIVAPSTVTSNVYTYQATSEDGKSQVNVVTGQDENSSFSYVTAISSTQKLPIF